MYLICSLFAHAESNSCSISSCYGFEVQMGYKMDINVKTICQVCFVAWLENTPILTPSVRFKLTP